MRSNLVYHIAINGEPYELKVAIPHKNFDLIKCGTDYTVSVTLPRFCTCQWPPCRTCQHIIAVTDWNKNRVRLEEAYQRVVEKIHKAELEQNEEAIVAAEIALSEFKATREGKLFIEQKYQISLEEAYQQIEENIRAAECEETEDSLVAAEHALAEFKGMEGADAFLEKINQVTVKDDPKFFQRFIVEYSTSLRNDYFAVEEIDGKYSCTVIHHLCHSWQCTCGRWRFTYRDCIHILGIKSAVGDLLETDEELHNRHFGK